MVGVGGEGPMKIEVNEHSEGSEDMVVPNLLLDVRPRYNEVI